MKATKKNVARRVRTPYMISSWNPWMGKMERIGYGDKERFDGAVKYFTKLGIKFKGFGPEGTMIAQN